MGTSHRSRLTICCFDEPARQGHTPTGKESSTMTTPISRRTGLLTLAGAVTAAALPRVARAQAATLKVGLVPIWDVGPYYAAAAQGYFTAENLDVSAQIVRGGAVGIPAMLNGALDIVYSNGTTIVTSIARGID